MATGTGSASRWSRLLQRASHLLWALALLVLGRPALAIPADIRLDQLHHTRWTVNEGAPAHARAMAQSGDGALWIGTDSGLFRFDGVEFRRVAAPERGGRPFGNVSALMGMPDGSMWIGLRFGGVYHWQAGRFTSHAEPQGLPSERAVFKFARGQDGRIWAGTSAGLFVLEAGRWRGIGAELGHPNGFIHDLVVDRDGVLWIDSSDGVFILARDAQRVVRVRATGMGYLATLGDGSVWMAPYPTAPGRSNPVLVRLTKAPGQPEPVHLVSRSGRYPGSIVGDRNGGLWMPYDGGKIIRLPTPARLEPAIQAGRPPAQAQFFGLEQGLSGPDPGHFFEDRDGNIWVGTGQGLDRFRVPRLRMNGDVLSASLHPGPDGFLWLCTPDGASSERGRVAELTAAGSLCEGVETMAPGRTLWALNRRLWVHEAGRIRELPLPAEAQPVQAIVALQPDRDGALWLSVVRQGLFLFKDGRWTRIPQGVDGFPPSRPLSMGRDGQGRVWLGYPGGQLVLPQPGGARSWGREQGLHVGNVRTITPLGAALLIGGSEGLARMQDGQVTMLRGADGEKFEGVTAVVTEPASEFVWVQSSTSIARLRTSELLAAPVAGVPALQLDRYDHVDGLRGLAPPQWPWPSAARGGDGRMWFSTTAGLFTLDPKDAQRSPPPPRLELRALRVEDADTPLGDDLTLPTGTTRIEIDYAAVNIALPERVRYRYRLDGLDTQWRQTGARRASYTNLPPGDYVFRVAAANEQGPWSEPEARLRLRIPPAFHQTTWFHASCALAAGLAVWLAWRLRLRQVTTRLRLRTEAQTQERERIARDLHDTLLQSTQGLMLSVQALADRTPTDHPEKARIERALERADQAVFEGRRKVMQLRTDDVDQALDALLGDLAAELSERGPAAVILRTEGEARPLLAGPHDEVLRIGQEALLNAHRHAQARQIDVLMVHGEDALVLRVSDDGIGISAGLRDGSQTRPGHFGLAGLRERAAALGAELSIRTGDAGGTVVELRVPAATAYGAARRV